jgi:hypothetical protein
METVTVYLTLKVDTDITIVDIENALREAGIKQTIAQKQKLIDAIKRSAQQAARTTLKKYTKAEARRAQ